jgi:acetylornithine deacetylase
MALVPCARTGCHASPSTLTAEGKRRVNDWYTVSEANMALLHELQNLVCELVAIESVNPDLVASGSGESNIARFVASWLREAGFSVDVVEPVAGRPSVVGILRGSGGGASLMLNAHMDTVGAGGMARAFDPVVADGRVYGRGAYDMKGSLAAIMIAAREAKGVGLKGDLMVAAVADEEVASFGTSAVAERFHADAAIVTEPTEMRLCLAHKGFVWLEVETHGVAAHGSRPELGVDAIARMGRILTGLTDLDRHLRGSKGHALLGSGSIHASLIEGGQELSTYPAHCIAKLERRTVPGEDGASSLREIEDVIAGAHGADPAVSASARVMLERSPSEIGAHEAVSEAVAKAALASLGREPEVIGVPYWMDMALLNAAGTPTVAFGPSGGGEHADVEWVDVSSLEKCVEVYVRAAEVLCR